MKSKTIVKLHSLNFFLLVTGITLALRLANAQCDPPPSGLVAWWPGEGNANDVVGTNNGTLQGGVTYAPGKVGQAFSLNGAAGAVNLGNAPEFDFTANGSFSISAWFNTSGTTGGGNDSQFIVALNNNCGQTAQALALKNGGPDSNKVIFLVRDAGGLGDFVISPSAATTGQFHHAVGVREVNGGTKTLRLYLDGVQVDTKPDPSTGQLSLDTADWIGRRNTCGTDNVFNGLIDEVAIFNRALSAAEIQSIYDAGSAGMCRTPTITNQPQSQIGYWGQSVTFSVGASPLPLNYQWQSNGVAIYGATNQTLTLTNLQNSFAAGYTVVVANSYGSVTSAPPANLTINPAGVGIALYPGVKIDGVVGLTYGIQSTTNLSNTNSWIGRTNLTFSVTNVIWSDYQPSPAQTFYRVLQGPIPIP